MKQAKVFMYSNFAGVLTEDENGYAFAYDLQYLASKIAEPINLTLSSNPTKKAATSL